MISTRAIVVGGVVLAASLAICVAPLASSSPDGLERVAEDHSIAATAQPVWQHAIVPDYAVPGVTHPGLATSLAGLVGCVVVLAGGLALGRLLVRRPSV